LKFSTVPDSAGQIPGRLHRGFLEALDSVWPELLDLLSSPRFQGLTVHLTGHSLGGASATIAAARLHASGLKVADVYAFASPRVGNEEFSNWYDLELGDSTFRFTRGLDIVTRVPPDYTDAAQFASLFPIDRYEEVKKLVEKFQYRHVGKAYVIERKRDSTLPEWPSGGDFGYWNWFADKITPKNPISSIFQSRDAVLHHIPEAFVCYSSNKLSLRL